MFHWPISRILSENESLALAASSGFHTGGFGLLQQNRRAEAA